MTSREQTLENFRAKFVATIGTAGSKTGMPLNEATNNFQKDWGSLNVYLRDLGHSNINNLLRSELHDVVTVRNNRVYPVVSSSNVHVFNLIDCTKKKKKSNRTSAVTKVSHPGKRTYGYQNFVSSAPIMKQTDKITLGQRTKGASELGNLQACRYWDEISVSRKQTQGFYGKEKKVERETSFNASFGQSRCLSLIDPSYLTEEDIDLKPISKYGQSFMTDSNQSSSTGLSQAEYGAYTSRNFWSTSSSFNVKEPAKSQAIGERDKVIVRKEKSSMLVSKNESAAQIELNSNASLPLIKSTPIVDSLKQQHQNYTSATEVVVNNEAAKKRTCSADTTAVISTPTELSSSNTENRVDRQFECNSLFRFQMLSIQKVTASSPDTKSSRTIGSVTKEVRELVALIYEAGRSMTLEELKKKYFDLKQECLTGVKLAEILNLERSKKNHFIALQSYRPPIFTCIFKGSVVSLSKDCDSLLEKMKIDGELPQTSSVVIATTGPMSKIKHELLSPPTVPSSLMDANRHTSPNIDMEMPIQAECKELTTMLSTLRMQPSEDLEKQSNDEHKNNNIDSVLSADFSRLSINDFEGEVNGKLVVENMARNYTELKEPHGALICSERLSARTNRLNMHDVKRGAMTSPFSNMPDNDKFFNADYVLKKLDDNLLQVMNKFNYSKKDAKRIIKERFNASNNF